MSLHENADRLVSEIAAYEGCAVAFSGGVDSAVVLQAARLALGERVVAVTGVGPALAAVEHDDARRLAEQIGVPLVESATAEIDSPGYVANNGDRCFHCKTSLYTEVLAIARERELPVVANGANADDTSDHRPGARAARDFAVRSPLADCGFGKAEVRELAEHWNLPIADKPASPCLASRLAYGVPVTVERLRRIEQAEALVRSLGVREFRVRYHADDLARIEAPLETLQRLAEHATRAKLVDEFTRLGFRYVTLDLAGFRSGNLNDVLPVESLSVWSQPARDTD